MPSTPFLAGRLAPPFAAPFASPWTSWCACGLLAFGLGQQPASELPARAIARELCASPRLAGTSGSLVGARRAARYLEAAGWEVELDAREVLLTYPRRQELELFAGSASGAAAPERAAAPEPKWVRSFDPDALPPGDVPLFSAWSASGTVRAPVVDVGHGLREDYEQLAAAGVDVRGALALARYGRSYRGIKADLAEEHGCAGLLLFSDDDGADQGPVWPFGPWKPGHEAQRGSISPMARAPGDPSTPGWPSPPPGARGARRLDAAATDARLPGIPCLPIGAEHAAWLLAGLGGPVSRGPGPVEARLSIDQPRELRTIYNVIARLPGRGAGLVLAGSHRDAWVRGGHDSASGAVALIRAAERLGERARGGWRPEHTLVIGLWDAEEFGLIGSTEWAEAQAGELRHCLAYVNADAAVNGPRFGASGTPGLLGVLRRVLERVPAPAADFEPLAADAGSLWEQWGADGEPRLGLPGSGSDFAVFLHHLSIPVLDVGFRGNSGGQYHTGFDDFPIVDRYLDPGYEAHELAGQVLAELLAELAESHQAGFEASEAARAMAGLVRDAGAEVDAAGAPWLGPDRAESLARAFDDLDRAASQGPGQDEAGFYRHLAAGDGLAARPWFKNRLWAPGLETGYRAETLPSLRQAARLGQAELEAELAALIAAVDELASNLTAIGRP